MDEVCGISGLWSMWCLSIQELLWQEHCFMSLLYVYICINLYPPVHLFIHPCIYAQRYLSIFKYICTVVCICWVYTGFLGPEVKYVKNLWQRKQGVVKCQIDNVDWLIWLPEVFLISGRGTGAKQEFVGAIKSRAVRWAHMVTQPGLMP